jgi:glutathione S-transferase
MSKMKLRYSPTSPFARKVRIAIHELGLSDRVEQIVTDPWTDAALRGDNPLGKVPSLVTAEGEALYDSPVICEYLDAVGGGGLFPPPGPARWRALRLQALADGIAEAVVRRFIEKRRPPEQWSQPVLERQRVAIAAALDSLEATAQELRLVAPTIGEVALAAALGYLDLREPETDWRAARPVLARWLLAFDARPACAETRPLR